ncbi:MAG: hypothetical protein OEU92_22295 [Alphaproteobacteria bacterium]|nr:hypothetical protein [Alphaproteobacteria bacterium]
MAEEALKIDPDAMNHKAFHEKAAKYGEAFEGSTFDPGVKAAESGRDYADAKADAQRGVFEGRGYDEDTAKSIDQKFEGYMNDRAEMDAKLGDRAGSAEAAPEEGKEERER